MLLLLMACVDYELNTGKDDPIPPDTTDTGTPCPPQLPDCHDSGDPQGGDSSVTEPSDCEVSSAAAGTVPILEACEGTGTISVTDPWNVAIEWQWTGLSSNPSVQDVITVPVIGNLTDDNGDGLINEDDSPDVMTVASADSSFTNGTLVILDGATGIEVWTKSGYNAGSGGALADVDGDGITDVIAQNSSGRWVALDANGSQIWQSEVGYTGYPQATVADLDEDGDVEVIADGLIIDGRTGATEARLNLTGSMPYRMPAVGDFDQDGDQEIVLGNTLFDHNGNSQWSAPFAGSYGHWTAIFDYDGDPEAEIGMIGSSRYGVFEADGTQLVLKNVNSSQPGPPCVADFDGDGAAEIAWASTGTFSMYELDGTVIWTESIDDSSGLAGCSGYDVDGDGAYEVLYADQTAMYIFDGPTGAVHYVNNGHASGTLWEYPAVADIDHDGSAEMVIGSNNYGFPGWGGITVFGQVSSTWPRSGTTWHVHDFAMTNINSDGTVPTTPVPPWQAYNVYRARPAVDDPSTPDLTLDLVDLCVANCVDGPIRISVQISNQGGADVEPGTSWVFYRNDGGTLTAVTSGTIPAVTMGTSIDSFEITVTPADIGTDGFIISIDDDGTGAETSFECDETNNRYIYGDPLCQ